MILGKLILLPLLVILSQAGDVNSLSTSSNEKPEDTRAPEHGAIKVMKPKQVKDLKKKVEKKTAEKCPEGTGLSAEEIQGCKAPKK